MFESRVICVVCVLVACLSTASQSYAETLQLSAIMPKLKAIHEDSQSLLIKNSELKAKILLGLQAQNEAKLQRAKESKQMGATMSTSTTVAGNAQTMHNPGTTIGKPPNDKTFDAIDYQELEEFNKWVDTNLEYAVKNTQASIDALKEEAQQNSGNVDYSDQAIKDGIEGVKYWQSAVIFQDKTLNNEKFEVGE